MVYMVLYPQRYNSSYITLAASTDTFTMITIILFENTRLTWPIMGTDCLTSLRVCHTFSGKPYGTKGPCAQQDVLSSDYCSPHVENNMWLVT
jgi:hypothetical protein